MFTHLYVRVCFFPVRHLDVIFQLIPLPMATPVERGDMSRRVVSTSPQLAVLARDRSHVTGGCWRRAGKPVLTVLALGRLLGHLPASPGDFV